MATPDRVQAGSTILELRLSADVRSFLTFIVLDGSRQIPCHGENEVGVPFLARGVTGEHPILYAKTEEGT